MPRYGLLSKNRAPDCVVTHHASRYGASFEPDGRVAIYDQTIRDESVRWKQRGRANWDPRHGMWAIDAHLPGDVAERLTECLRRRDSA